jgi:hypothetical protein
MSSFSWTFEDADGQQVEPDVGQPATGFPTQADAEAWVGETWRTLLAAGVEQVRLFEDSAEVYGPMSLRPVEEQ